MTKRPYKITFLTTGLPDQTVEVRPDVPAEGGVGETGSVLDVALGAGIDIDHACGGVRACSTCHVVVRKGYATCNPSTDEELDQLDKAPGLTPESRLACQCIATGEQDLVVEIPRWNRNLVREGAH